MIRTVTAIATAVAFSACSAGSDSVSNNSVASAEAAPQPDTAMPVTAHDKAATIFFCMRWNACAVQPIPMAYAQYKVSEYRIMHDDGSNEKLLLPSDEDAFILLRTTSEGCVYSLTDTDLSGSIDKVTLEGGPAKKCKAMRDVQQAYVDVLDYVIQAILTMESSSSEPDDAPDDEDMGSPNQILI